MADRTWKWAHRWDGQGKAHLAHRNWPEHGAGHTACGLGFPRGEDNGVVLADDSTPRCQNCQRSRYPLLDAPVGFGSDGAIHTALVDGGPSLCDDEDTIVGLPEGAAVAAPRCIDCEAIAKRKRERVPDATPGGDR